ncbi:YrhK family protein [uncultured Salinisphaera sp.]|uniref:YrhK family protein n=1 Tax=uncultured Salinisphaera sp. TaxID=359372 RepID=UPI0032B27024
MATNQKTDADILTLHFGREELVIRQRYEMISIANDVLIGVWFLIGTIFFFYDSLVYWGTWLFLIGSIEMLIRPTIRLVRRLHLQRFHSQAPGTADAGHDF